MRKLWVACVGVLISCVALPAQADSSFTVDDATISAATGTEIANTFNINASGAQVASVLNSAMAPYLTQLSAVVGQTLHQLRLQRFLNAFANANAGASKSFSSDYASDPTVLTLGFSAAATTNATGGASGLGEFLSTRNIASAVQNGVSAVGGSVSLGFLLGLNLQAFELPDLGPIEWSRLTVYGSFGFYSGQLVGVAVNMKNYGVHATYRIIDQVPVVPGGIVRWGGLQVGLGFDVASLALSMKAKVGAPRIANDLNFGNRTLEAYLDYTASSSFTGSMSTWSIPLEVYTNVQLAYAINLYVGGALDFNFGRSALDVEGDAPISVTLRDPSNNTQFNALNPVGHLTYVQTGQPTLFDARGFVGLQLNLWTLGTFAQFNFDTSGNLGANAGARLFW